MKWTVGVLLVALIACEHPAPPPAREQAATPAPAAVDTTQAIPAAQAAPDSDDVVQPYPPAYDDSVPPPPGASLVRVDSTFRLELLPAMNQLLQDSAPGFIAWTIEHYNDDVRQMYHRSRRNVPWAVIGDFNGDGVSDVVVDGRDRTRFLRIVLMSSVSGFRFLVLGSSTITDPSAPIDNNSIAVLVYQPPQDIETQDCPEEGPCKTKTFKLTADAFQAASWEKASSLWYWTESGFKSFTTSD